MELQRRDGLIEWQTSRGWHRFTSSPLKFREPDVTCVPYGCEVPWTRAADVRLGTPQSHVRQLVHRRHNRVRFPFADATQPKVLDHNLTDPSGVWTRHIPTTPRDGSVVTAGILEVPDRVYADHRTGRNKQPYQAPSQWRPETEIPSS